MDTRDKTDGTRDSQLGQQAREREKCWLDGRSTTRQCLCVCALAPDQGEGRPSKVMFPVVSRSKWPTRSGRTEFGSEVQD